MTMSERTPPILPAFLETHIRVRNFLDYSMNFNKCGYRSRQNDAHLEAEFQL